MKARENMKLFTLGSGLMLSALFALSVPEIAYSHDDPHHPHSDVLMSCVIDMDNLPVNLDLGDVHRASEEILVGATPDTSDTCNGYFWVTGSAHGVVFVPRWAGRETSSAWDCKHSFIEYALYTRDERGWELKGGGQMWGELTDGKCVYSTQHFPRGWGGNGISAVNPSGGSFRIAVKAWSHNDRRLGHPGTDCADTSCYWPVKAIIYTVPLSRPAPPPQAQGPDLAIDSTAGTNGDQFQFRILNIGNEDAGAFTTQVYFDLRTEDRPTVGRNEIQTSYLGAGGSVDESVGVPSECFSQDSPIEERGCDVFVHADSQGKVKEADEKNNSWPF